MELANVFRELFCEDYCLQHFLKEMGNHIALLAALLAATVSWSYGDNTDEQIPLVLGESYDFGVKLHLKLEVISSSIQG